MSRYSQEMRDSLREALKFEIDRYNVHANANELNKAMRAPSRLKRLQEKIDIAKAALDAHIEQWGPNGDGKPHPFGVFMHFEGQQHQIFVDGRALTIDDISQHFSITKETITNE